MQATHATRFWQKVRRTDTCWLWTGADNGRGYGHFYLHGRIHQAHRVAYELAVGPIPDVLEIDHLCRVRQCVRPDHLEPVTPRENTRRAAALVTACPKGHPYTDANTYRPRASGYRQCRTCHTARERVRRARRAEGRT